MGIGSRQIFIGAAAVMLAGLVGVGSAARWQRQGSQAAAPTKPLLVDDVFKNVQALKGIGVDDFLLTMGIMSAAVGSDCVGLPSLGRHRRRRLGARHTEKAHRHGAWCRWLLAINKRQLRRPPGGDVLDLPSRPRSAGDRPRRLDTVYGEPILEPDDVLTPAPGVPSVDQVLNKYLQAIGGAQAVAGITSFVATGKSVGYRGFGGGGLVEISAQAPDKRATHITFPEYPDRGVSVRTYDGRTGWIATPLAVVRKYELGGSERDGARLDAQLSFPAQIKQALTDLRVGPPATIDDKDVQVLQGNGPNGTLATLYFDETSGLLVRHGAPRPLADRPRADAGGLFRLPRRRRDQVSVPLDIRLARRPGQFRVQ